LKRKGLSERHIARRLGVSRNTVRKYIEHGGYPERVRSETHRASMLDRFRGNISGWLEEDMGYKATLIYDRLRPMGFTGSYEIVKRAVHAIKAGQQLPTPGKGREGG
jgi:transposase